MADSGSAPNVANHKKHFPGSQLVKDTGSSVQFQTATGQPFESKGKLTVDAESMEGYRRRIVFDDADVSIPILSIGLMTDNDNDVLFQKKGGKIIQLPTGEEIAFIRMHGVYFVELKFDMDILEPTVNNKVVGAGVGA